jgi:hypothetical protein
LALRGSLAATIVALAILYAGASERPAEGSHRAYVVENSTHNPNGSANPNLWGVHRAWVIDGQPLRICSDWGQSYSSIPAGIRQAVEDWEEVLPGTQLGQTCPGSGGELWIKRRSASSGFPINICGGFVACVPFEYAYDPLREANYPTASAVIWFDDQNFSFTADGWRATAAHELGHIFGLDEYYMGDQEDDGPEDVECNPNGPNSVMNALSASGNLITGPCPNGSVSPTQRDIDLVEDFYSGNLPGSGDFQVTLLSPSRLSVRFVDREWAEAGYQLFAYRWTGSYWANTGETWVRTVNVGKKDFWNETTYYQGASQPDGEYKVCMSAMTEIYWLSGWQCSPSAFMGDRDVRATADVILGPAAVILSNTQWRTAWLVTEVTNEGDYIENVWTDMVLVPTQPPSGCSRTFELILPREQFYIFPGETRFMVYRVRYRCHSPATQQVLGQYFTFTIGLIDGQEPQDALLDNTDALSNLVVIEGP